MMDTESSNQGPTGRFLTNSKVGILIAIAAVALCNRINLLDPLLDRQGISLSSPGGSTSLLTFLGIPLALLMIWLIWRLKRGTLAELGLSRPASWPKTIAIGIAVAVAVQGFGALMHLLQQNTGGETPDISRIEPIKGNLSVLLMWLTVAWTTAGFGEEVIWRGFMIGQISKLLNSTKAAWIAGLLFSSVLFGLLHAYQGMAGIIATGMVGLMLGIVYLVFNRNLWITIIAHGTMNTIAFVLMYFGAIPGR